MFDIIIYTPVRTLFEGKVKRAVFPGEGGVLEILPYHKPLVSRLVSGNVVVVQDSDEQSFPIVRGIVGVNRNKTTVVVEEA